MHRFNILSIVLCSLVVFYHINSYEAACHCPSGTCCSRRGYCGIGAKYCGAGCQGGKCWLNHGQRQSGSYSGQCTYYSLQGGITACGSQHSDNEYVVAMNAAQFDPYTPNGNQNLNSLCGKQIQVNGPGGSAVVSIVDQCSSCPYGGLDLSPSAFQAVVGDLSIGVAQVTWQYL